MAISQQQKDEIRRLMDRVAEIAESVENKRKIAHWVRYWAGTPCNVDPVGPMFTMDIGISTWSRILGFRVADFYGDTAEQIRCSLMMRIWQFENLGDDTVVGTGIGVNPVGVVLEPSMLGVEIGFPPDMEPWAFSMSVSCCLMRPRLPASTAGCPAGIPAAPRRPCWP